MSLSSSSYDFLDVIDLDSVLKADPGREDQEKRGRTLVRSRTPGKYISLESISDDELHLITRSLITPVSFQYDPDYTNGGRPFRSRNVPHRSRQHNKILGGNEHSQQPITYRSESAAIFDRLNNDDEFPVDFVTSDLKDFIDPDLLAGVISRPVSRVPKFDSISLDHGPSGRIHNTSVPSNIESTYDLPAANASYVPHSINNETFVRPVDKYKQHITNDIMNNNDVEKTSPSATSNYSLKNSKRHSMDAEVLMTLRRDSDALLQRRESLLRLRKFSDGITPPDILTVMNKPTGKSVNHRPEVPAPATRLLPLEQSDQHNLLLGKDNLIIRNSPQSQYGSTHKKSKPSFPQGKYDSSLEDINLAFKSTTITDEKQLKRVRSVSFPDHNQRMTSFNVNHENYERPSAAHVDVLVPQVSSPCHDHRYPKANTQYHETQYPMYSRAPKDKCRESVHSDHRGLDYDASTRFLLGREKSADQHNGFQLDTNHTNDRQSRKSVTESAKTLLANVRQRRADDRKEICDRRSSSLSYSNHEVDNKKSTTDTYRRKSTLTKTETSIISPKTTRNYRESNSYSPKTLAADTDNIHASTKLSRFPSRGEVPDSRYSTVPNRRWSSSLPLSSSLHSAQANYMGNQNESISRNSKLKQPGKKYNYVAKKSALDKSKDRYVALLGKPPSSK